MLLTEIILKDAVGNKISTKTPKLQKYVIKSVLYANQIVSKNKACFRFALKSANPCLRAYI